MTDAYEPEDKLAPNFSDFGLTPAILEGVRAAGFRYPSPIQSEAIPVALAGRDLIGQAHTGTGKTAAFGLPLMSRMHFDRGVELLVITPTRELAGQVSDEIFRLGSAAGVRTVAIYGGQSYTRQIKLVSSGAHVIVATPGRMLDLLNGGKLGKFSPAMVVLDEADEMLDMGFIDDVRAIFAYLPEQRQTLMFSATMPKPIQHLADSLLKNPVRIKTIAAAEEATNKDIDQTYYVMEEHEREDALVRLLEDQNPEKAILFCRTRIEVDALNDLLTARGYSVKALHGDMDQTIRNKVMGGFRRGDFDLLVATDVASRGLDVSDVSHVFNYHIPFNSKAYIHRIGRTGRAGKKGKAITLATPREVRQISRIQQLTGSTIQPAGVPSLGQLRLARVNRLTASLHQVQVRPEAVQTVEAMRDEMPPAELAARLVTLLLQQQTESGPDRIGLAPDAIHRLGKASGYQGKPKVYGGYKPRGKPRGGYPRRGRR